MFRKDKRRTSNLETLFEQNPLDLGDHAARPHDLYPIAYADVFALQLLLVMQGCARNAHSSHSHGLKVGNGGQNAATPDLNFDGKNARRHSALGKLVRDSPQRMMTAFAQQSLPAQVVRLVDQAVGFERPILALRAHFQVAAPDRRLVLTHRGLDCGQSRLCQQEHLLVGGGDMGQSRRRIARIAVREGSDSPREEAQRTRGGHGSIQLSQRTCCCVARVCKNLLAFLLLLFA